MTYVLNGYSLTGTVEAIEYLAIKVVRLAAFENMVKDVPGYPSIIEMDLWLREKTRP